MKKSFLECGKIVNTHGIKGSLKVMPWTDDPYFFQDITQLYLGAEKSPIKVTSARQDKNTVVMTFEGVDDMDAALALKNKVLYARREDIILEEGEYLVQDLLDLEVLDSNSGQSYGKIVDVTQTGANDVYHIKDDMGTLRLIPAIPQVIDKVDIDGGRMEITPLEGLFDDEN